MKVSLHKRKTTTRNPLPWVIVYDDGDGGWYRKLAHIGVDHRPLASRNQTEKEAEATKKSYRLTYFSYENIELLIEDEERITDNKEWIEKLKTFI